MGEIVSLPEVEYRLLRACKTLRALPDREAKFHIVRSYWPPTADDPDVAYGYNDERMPKFVPKPRDVSDFLVALAWVRGIERKDFRLLWWRSFGLSFGRIGNFIHKSDESARRAYRDVIMAAWAAANGNPIDKVGKRGVWRAKSLNSGPARPRHYRRGRIAVQPHVG